MDHPLSVQKDAAAVVAGEHAVVHIGFDDVPAASWPAYDLTTVRQPANRMVAETVSILLDQIEDNTSPPRRIALDGPLILRGSARIPEGWTK